MNCTRIRTIVFSYFWLFTVTVVFQQQGNMSLQLNNYEHVERKTLANVKTLPKFRQTDWKHNTCQHRYRILWARRRHYVLQIRTRNSYIDLAHPWQVMHILCLDGGDNFAGGLQEIMGFFSELAIYFTFLESRSFPQGGPSSNRSMKLITHLHKVPRLT